VALLDSRKTVYVWNIEDGSLVNTMETDLTNFNFARITNDGKIWIAPSIQPAPWGIGQRGYPLINEIAFSPDGKEIHTAYGNNQTVETQTCIINIQENVTCSPARSGDWSYFQPWTDWAIIGSDGQLYQFTRLGEEFTIRKGMDGAGETVGTIKSKSLIPPELFVASQPFMLFGSSDGLTMTNFNEIKVWLQGDPSKIRFSEGSEYSVSADNKVLALRDLTDNKNPDSKIQIVDMHTLETMAVMSSAYDDRTNLNITRFTLSPDGSQLALVTSLISMTEVINYEKVVGQKITMFDTRTGNELYSKYLKVEPRQILHYSTMSIIDPVQDMKFSPDGSILVLVSPDSSIFINAESGVVINTVTDMTGYRVTFSPDGKLIALNGYLKGILLWGVQP
jgi:WD40 repeat protein